MLLEKLVLENYGVYADRIEIDLSTSPKKPIVLVGGLNGAGKTTLFESIMVALYGKTYLGARTTKNQYFAFVIDRIHRYKNGHRARHASIKVVFRFYHNGAEDTYSINRSWDVDGMSVSESLMIEKNGQPMNDVNESLWQSFIEGLIPIGIARLFFFDGEKIVRVTQWSDADNAEIKTSLDVLLGTELVNRLYADLDLYIVRKSGTGAQDKFIQNKYKDLLKEKEQVSSEIESLNMEYEQKNLELQATNSKIAAKELKIVGMGGGYADMRIHLLTEKAVLGEKLRSKGKEINEEFANDAPLYLASSMLGDIKKQMRQDIDIIQQKSAISLISESVQKFKKDISSKEFRFDDPASDVILDKIHKRLDDLIKKPEKNEFFDMSPHDMKWMQQKIDHIKMGSEILREKLDKYGRINTRLAETESDLVKIPRDDEIGPRISEINNLYQEIGMLRAEIANITQEISSKNAYQKILQSKLRELIDTLHKNKTSSAGLDLASRIKKVLNTYHTNLRERKMSELETHLLNTVRILLHKEMISKIKVDRETFEIKVYVNNNENESIPGDLLSMGERQMVGTALLWAIARTCGRSLPFIIDTPLGRLDGEHLTNLTDKFYPFVSHQLILLSTDREIGQKEYDKLSRYISHSYHISYNSAKLATTIRPGYFVREKSIA